MPNGWLINLQVYGVIFAIIYLSGLFRNVTVDCSTVEATLTLAKEIRDQGRYCMWKSYNESISNFKERDVPIALIFIIDHNLTPIKLKLVLDIYHAIACLLPNDSNHLFAAVLHLPKNPKLYFGKLVNIRKLHRSFENAGEATKVLKASLIEFLNEILFESIIADAIFSTNLTYNWIKYDFEDFKRHSQQSVAFESWTWLLNFLRVTFFLIGAFIMLITTCALCGFACMLSSVLRDDYYRRQQMREREEELRILEERLRESGVNIHFNVFDHQSDLERESNNETNTAIEQISILNLRMRNIEI
uniref:Uncharacterized protein n=1 Tax=Onchocerca volvulus TaxID=6282 RepID=A0A8R1XPS8_ONCVO